LFGCMPRRECKPEPALEEEKTALKKPSQESFCPCTTVGLMVVRLFIILMFSGPVGF